METVESILEFFESVENQLEEVGILLKKSNHNKIKSFLPTL